MHWQYDHFSTETYTYWLYALAVWSLQYRNIQLLAVHWQYGHFGTETYTYWLSTGSMVISIQHTPTGCALAMWSLQYRNIHLLFKTVTKTCKFYSAISLPHPPFPLHPEKEQKLNMRQDLNDKILLDTICDPFSPIKSRRRLTVLQAKAT